jgi:hypothetical protein
MVQTAAMPLSLHEQLFQAYADSVRKAYLDEGHECSGTIIEPGETEVNNHIVSPTPQVRVLNANKSSDLDVGSNVVVPMLQQGHIPDAVLRNSSPTLSSTAADSRHCVLHRSTMEAWDQIGDLANEISHSVIVKQAEMLNTLAKKDSRIRKQQLQEGDMLHINKKQRTSDDSGVVSSSSAEQEDASSCDTTDTVAVSSLSSEEDDVLGRQVERMIRMTNYIAEMERIHGLFRSEMEALTGEDD